MSNSFRYASSSLLPLLALLFIFAGCRVEKKRARPPEVPRDPSLVRVTGYCNCEICCGWRRSCFGFGSPVYAEGPLKGKLKKVGITASGTETKHGTIAADPQVFRFGTRLNVPGYGIGTVEDVGGSIKRRHIDLWFPTHAEARQWGSKWLKIEEVK